VAINTVNCDGWEVSWVINRVNKDWEAHWAGVNLRRKNGKNNKNSAQF